VKNARKALQKSKLQHQLRTTRNSTQNLARSQKALYDAFLTAEANFVQNKINTVAGLHTANQHSASWKV